MKKGWEYKTLGECCDIYNGNSINSDYKMKNFAGRKEGYPFIATKDISFNGIINYDNGIKIPYDSTFKIAYPESVFICAEGGSAGRKIAFVNEKVCFGNKLFCISPHTNSEFIGKYIYYYLNSDYFQKQFQSLLTGLIGGVSAKKFKEITIIKNSIDEQHRIVSYLDSSFDYIDKIKEKASKSLSEAKALFQSALAEAMEPKEGWEEKTLGDVSENIKNINWKNESSAYKYIDLSSVDRDNSIILNTVIVNKTNAPSRAKQLVNNNDIIFATTRPLLRRVTLIEKEYDKSICSTGFCVIRPNNNIIDPKYVFYVFKDEPFYQYIEPLQNGASYPAVTDKAVKSYTFSFPKKIEVQKQIVSRLDSLSSKVRAIEEKYQKMVEECDALKQAMLRDVFE